MRRIVAFNNVSADGYFARTNGSLDWVVPDDDIGREGVSRSQGTGTILFGRRTYEMFESFWPHALADDKVAPDPHIRGRTSETMRAMAVFINDAVKIVFSRTLKNPTWKNTRVVPELDSRAIEALKREEGGDMMLFGSGSIASQLTAHRLIDEYQFVVNATILGAGKTLLHDVPNATRVELVEAKPHASGNVMLRYRPQG